MLLQAYILNSKISFCVCDIEREGTGRAQGNSLDAPLGSGSSEPGSRQTDPSVTFIIHPQRQRGHRSGVALPRDSLGRPWPSNHFSNDFISVYHRACIFCASNIFRPAYSSSSLINIPQHRYFSTVLVFVSWYTD